MTGPWTQIAVVSLMLVGLAQAAPIDPCRLGNEHGALSFPVDQLTDESRCLLAEVVEHPSVAGIDGPRQTPIGIDLYGYLLDHPIVTAMLMQRMGLGSLQVTARGADRYWVNDGEGAEGLLSLLFADAHTRIYYIDGRHRSPLFPTVRARTAVFMRILPRPVAHGRPIVHTVLATYTRFEDGLLSRLMRLFQPLVTRAVNRTLAKELSMTDRLGVLVAEQPQRILDEAAGLPHVSADDRRMLLALLQADRSSSHAGDLAP